MGRFFIEFNEATSYIICLVKEASTPFKLEGGSRIDFTQLALCWSESSVEFYLGF
jgi:hypothetical protein